MRSVAFRDGKLGGHRRTDIVVMTHALGQLDLGLGHVGVRDLRQQVGIGVVSG